MTMPTSSNIETTIVIASFVQCKLLLMFLFDLMLCSKPGGISNEWVCFECWGTHLHQFFWWDSSCCSCIRSCRLFCNFNNLSNNFSIFNICFENGQIMIFDTCFDIRLEVNSNHPFFASPTIRLRYSRFESLSGTPVRRYFWGEMYIHDIKEIYSTVLGPTVF